MLRVLSAKGLTMRQHPEQILHEWMDAVNTGNVPDLTALYDPSAVLIPTFSSRLLKTPEMIEEYFIRLGSREELSVALHEKTVISQTLGDQIYALSGIYCWRFAIDGELLNFEARFNYMLDLKKPSPIMHHHSSQIPRVI